MQKQWNNTWFSILIGSLIMSLALAGCATTGGGAATADEMTKSAPAAPAVKDEVGENGLPTVRALRARHIEAVGGEKAIRAHSSMTAKGKMELPSMGMSGDLVMYTKAPNQMVMNIEIPGMGSMNNGFDGEKGWSDNPMTGPALLEGDALEDMRFQANFYSDLMYDEGYPTQETLEETEFNGESAYKVRLLDARGKEYTEYYSEASGLLIGSVSTQSSPMGEIEVKVKIGGYEDFGGLLLPTSQVMDQMGMEIKNTIESITFDDVEASAFEPPASIKALMK